MIKDIVVDTDGGMACSARLACAASIAERFDAHLIACYVEPQVPEPNISFEVASTRYLETVAAERKSQHDAARACFDSTSKRSTASMEWRETSGVAARALSFQARYADLLVLGQADPDRPRKGYGGVADDVLLAAGSPVLMVPYIGAPDQVGRRILLAWSGTRESARAVRDALPWLREADKVIVLTVDRDESSGAPGTGIATHLARHGVEVEVRNTRSGPTPIGQLILSACSDADIDMVVAGAYGHSRVRELVLGGVTRDLLQSMTVPVLFSH